MTIDPIALATFALAAVAAGTGVVRVWQSSRLYRFHKRTHEEKERQQHPDRRLFL
jgi:hypothetical protein